MIRQVFSRASISWITGALAGASLALILFAAPAFASGTATGEQPLTLRTQVTVDANTVRIGDIFSGIVAPTSRANADTVVAYAPPPGRAAIFDASWLSRVAQRYRLNWRPATRLDRVIVERASNVVTGEMIAAALHREVVGRGTQQDIDLDLSNRALMVHIESDKPATVEVVNLSIDARHSQFSAIIAIPAGDPHAQRMTVAGTIHPMVEVPVPASSVRPGDVIRERDIRWKRVRTAQVRNTIATETVDIVGRVAYRPLSAGKLIRKSDLRDQETVTKGSTVTMVYQTNSMLLTTIGRALESGATGDFVSVRNSRTRLVVDARILGPNKVEVLSTPQLAANQGTIR